MATSPRSQHDGDEHMSVLERVCSMVEETTPVPGGTELPETEEEPYVHHYMFKRLAVARELPSRNMEWAMLWVRVSGRVLT